MPEFTQDLNITLHLRDGRALGAAITGKSGGYPIFHFHGSGSSRLEVSLLAELAEQRGALLIGLDRPGYGLSERKPGGRLLDWPADVAEAADQLGIARFAVDGLSAGGPYALACAYQIPSRLTACALISSVPPPQLMRQAGPAWMRLTWQVGKLFPSLFRLFLRLAVKDQAPSLAEAEKMLLRGSRFMAPADVNLMQDPVLRTGIAQAFVESLRSGGQGERDSAMALLPDWGFTPQQVQLEHISIWHGLADRVMPVAPQRLLAEQLPHCTAHFIAGEGHFSLIVNHAGYILDTLVGSTFR